MQRLFTAVFFSFTLLLSVITTSLLTLLNESHDICFIEKSGEGEEENKESIEDVETKIFYSYEKVISKFTVKKIADLRYYQKKYNSLSKELFSPPPELGVTL